MSSPYPILDKRPIDQWKVTELKEELKRRKFMTKGLKEDLIKRLDEALQNEMEIAKEDLDTGFNCEPQPEVSAVDIENVPIVSETAKDLVDHGDKKYEKAGDDLAKVNTEDSTIMLGQGNVLLAEVLGGSESSRAEEVIIVQETTVETSTTISKVVVSEITSDVQDIPNSDIQKQNGNLNTQLENDDCEPQVKNLDLNPPSMDVTLYSSFPINQVSEVIPVLGFQVKSDSISTDSVSIDEKNDIKDNKIADSVKLELEVVKKDMVETSFSNVVPDGGELHPMDDEEPREKDAVEEKDENNAINSDMSKEKDTLDVGYSEKLNIDRSSGDASMEEDVVENKQIDSNYNSDEVDDKSAETEVSVVKEEVHVVGDDMPAEIKDVYPENTKSAAPMEKRKLQDQEAVENSEPSKMQRRWNSQSLKVPEPQSSSITLSTTTKDTFQSPSLKRNFSRSDSTKSEAAPKERVVPPSSKSPSNSLRIDCFVRPFTLKAVQELLGKTGSVTSFWMDHIKTHCYVTYSSVEEAMETRNTVYNLQWPPNGGLLLVAEFVDPQEVRMRVEPPLQPPAAPVSIGPAVPSAPPTLQLQHSLRQQVLRRQLPPPPSLPPPPPLSNLPPVRERLTLPPPPPLPENFDPLIVTLDDLFRKTKATPRIYYLPLSEEQVAARGKNIKQFAGFCHKKELFRPSLCERISFVDGFKFSETASS